VTATHSDGRIECDYVWRNLVSAYTVAAVAVAVGNLVGGWAYRQNRAAFDLSPSTLVSVTRGRNLDLLFPECCHGVQPLQDGPLEADLEVRETCDGGRPGRNVVLVRRRADLRGVQSAPPIPSREQGGRNRDRRCLAVDRFLLNLHPPG
jgi:hypothetical protein